MGASSEICLDVQHHIDTGQAQPVMLHVYQEKAKKELDETLNLGIIEPSNSEQSAPLILVTKKYGTLQIYIDYWHLNGVSTMDTYPCIDNLIDHLGKGNYISTVDFS